MILMEPPRPSRNPLRSPNSSLRPPFRQNPPLPPRPPASAPQLIDFPPESAKNRPVHTSVALIVPPVHIDAQQLDGVEWRDCDVALSRMADLW
jgi:hypothetical protein